MKAFLPKLIIGALSLGAAAYIVPGIYIDGMMTLLIAAFLLGIVNAILRPVLVILTFPITIVTLGIFLLIINGAMLLLVAWILPGFSIAGFGPAILGWLILAVINWLGMKIFADEK
jgi:putative membrane protein